ncbi:MAG: rane protein [Labilithrix sp.]|nr:rane protein [Labilithrix sp.]
MRKHTEGHRGERGGWLRAAVLGADDGVVSTASLMMGVAAAQASRSSILVAGVAGLVAGALSMAAGEYVSVSSQRDAEEADIAREMRELEADPPGELEELAGIYRRRGLAPELALEVAKQLSDGERRLDAHLRDELGLQDATRARPLQAAAVSAASFASMALLPIIALLLAPPQLRIAAIAGVSVVSLAALGGAGGHLGGAPVVRAAFRVVLGGTAAMAITALIGHLLGTAGAG